LFPYVEIRERDQRSITEQSIPSTKAKQALSAVVITALANQLDYEEWFLKAADEGIADPDAGRTFSTREALASIAKQRNERAAHKRKQAA
jgi:predicted transcriptional regulator